jgi:membrane protease YdiL (CAAX protease family)
VEKSNKAKNRSLIPDISIFVFGCLLQFVAIYWAVPLLSNKTGIMQLGSWMLLSIPLIFLPITIGGFILLRTEQHTQKLSERLLLHKLTKQDWWLCLMGFLVMAVGSGITFYVCLKLGLNSNPPFARNVQAWTDGHFWMFGLWAIYWPINILSENIVWRGIILPRMEFRIGKLAWLLNAFMWGLFHLAFGLGNIIILLPTLLVVPYVAQKSRNTWTAVFLHACLSFPGFVALAFGLMK